MTSPNNQNNLPLNGRPNGWLNQYARNVYSQFGEDGILEQALRLLPVRDKWCVEFGAHDGLTYSNSANLITAQEYRAVLIEPDARRYAKLVARYRENSNVKTIPRRVGFGAADSLDVILDPLGIPADFDLLSIDIDGNDYHAWSAVTIYHPKIVVVEFNPTIATGVEFVQERNPRVQQGSSISSINALAREKQYELVAVTWNNAIFVASEYFPAFEIADNSIHALRDDSSGVTHFFYGYDGQVFLRGQRSMIWHGVPLSAAMAQQLPVSLRGSPEDFGPVRSTLLKVYRRLRCIAQRVPWGASPTRGSTPKP